MLRPLPLLLLLLILLMQYPLWLGKGGWLKVWELEREVEMQRAINREKQQRNAVLDAEVRDLKQGYEAVEERARNELGMVRRDEVFFQFVGNGRSASAASAAP